MKNSPIRRLQKKRRADKRKAKPTPEEIANDLRGLVQSLAALDPEEICVEIQNSILDAQAALEKKQNQRTFP